MTDEDHNLSPLQAGLQGVSNTTEVVVEHLWRMANGQDPYRCFTYTSPAIKGIWHAAADLIEQSGTINLN